MSPLFTVLLSTILTVLAPIIWVSRAVTVTPALFWQQQKLLFSCLTPTSWWGWCHQSPRSTEPVTWISRTFSEWPDSKLWAKTETSQDKWQKLTTLGCISVRWNVQLANPDLSIESINYTKLDRYFNGLASSFENYSIDNEQSVSLEQTFLRGSGQAELMNSLNWFLQNRKIISSSWQ